MSAYHEFIERCRSGPKPESGEWHHVVPRSQWPGYRRSWDDPEERRRWNRESGVNDPSNLVFLGHWQHIEAHWLYATETGRCWAAVVIMLDASKAKLESMSDVDRERLKAEHAGLREAAMTRRADPAYRKVLSDSAKRRQRRQETELSGWMSLEARREGRRQSGISRRSSVNLRAYRWRRDDGLEETLSPYDLIERYGLHRANVLALVYGAGKKGVGTGRGTPKWRLVGEV